MCRKIRCDEKSYKVFGIKQGHKGMSGSHLDIRYVYSCLENKMKPNHFIMRLENGYETTTPHVPFDQILRAFPPDLLFFFLQKILWGRSLPVHKILIKKQR